MSRQAAYKENPKLAMETDWITANEEQLRKMHLKCQNDTGDKIPFIQFADYIYRNAQDLINQTN
jgi:hypothetical protein